MPRLLVEKGLDRGLELLLVEGQNYVVGRDESVDLIIKDEMASRKHCLVGERKGAWLIKDLGSVNGTKVNGRPLEANKAGKLAIGDTIEIGETLISLLPSSHDDQDPLVGKTLGGFRIDDKLGRGAMGVVYRAHQISLKRDVALKVLSSDVSHDQRFKEMMIKEARAAAALSHHNILQVYEVGEDQGHLFIAMELALKGSVLEELRRDGQIKLDRSLQIVKDALRALGYAERKGLVHRDIKPDNLMITADGDVKLGDLGLAATAAELTGDQSGVFGTPHYIAPEQAQGKPLDHRADIYALGATWYRMLTGQTLFQGNNAKEILRRQVREAHRPLNSLMPDIPPTISTILDRMLAKEPDQRYPSATNVLEDLELFQTNRNVSISAIGQSAREGGVVVVQKKQNKGVLIGVGVGALAIVAGIGFVISGMGGDPEANGGNQNNTTIANVNSNAGPLKTKAEIAYEAALFDYNRTTTRGLGIQSMRDLIKMYPDSPQAEECRGYVEAWDKERLAEDQRKAALQAKATGLVGEFEALKKRIEEELKLQLKGTLADTLLKDLQEQRKNLSEESDTLKAALDEAFKDIDVEAYRLSVPTKVHEHFTMLTTQLRRRVDDLKKLPVLERPARLEAAIKEANDLKASTDVPALSEQLTTMILRWEEQLKAAEAERNVLWRDQAYQAAGACALRLRAKGGALDQARGACTRFDFEAAMQAVAAFRDSDPDLKAGAENPFWSEAFKPIQNEIADRQAQTRLEAESLEWLVQTWTFSGTPKNLQDGGNHKILKVFSDLKTLQVWPSNVSGYVRMMRGRTDGNDEKAPVNVRLTDIGLAGLAGLLDFWIRTCGDEGNFDALSKDRANDRYFAGIASLLLEAHPETEPHMEFFLEHPEMVFARAYQNGVERMPIGDDKRRMRGIYAACLVARAEGLRRSGDLIGAQKLLDRVRVEFADTPVAQSMQAK